MKLFWFLFILSLSANSQIDYSAHPETIGSLIKIIRVDWLKSTPGNCQIDFNHLVNFINVKSDQIFNSKVTIELYRNNELIRSFLFSTGEQITNRIYVGEAIHLKRRDMVYFLFKLSPATESEEYVFNIYETLRAAIKTITFVKPQKESENISQ